MSLSDHRYVARIAPCSLTTADAVHSGATLVERGERFTESFAPGGLIWPLKPVPVLFDHEETQQVGFVSDLVEQDGWYESSFVLEMDRTLSPAVVEYLRVGTPVSIGAKSLRRDEAAADLGIGIKRHTVAVLEEVSILSPGITPAYRGAKVTRITERGTARDRMRERQHERAEAKPKPPKPALSSSPPITVAAAAPPVMRRDQITERADAERAELNRRLDWLEKHTGRPADTEAVIVGMQRELNGPTLDDLIRKHGLVGVR